MAIAGRFADALHAPLDPGVQQWWATERLRVDVLAPLFRDFDNVYGAGQFTWAGLWTVSNPPDVAHAQLIDAWELYYGPNRRRRLPARASARVFEIHQPADWVRLVTEHPRDAASHLEHWELPGLNQDPISLTPLTAVPGQRAAHTCIRRHLVPDWRSVAGSYDGVHLSWAGFITAEGCITDLGDGDVAMLRYWASERTHWLADIFDDPEPAPPPSLSERTLPDGSPSTVDVRTHPERRHRDRHALDQLLGR